MKQSLKSILLEKPLLIDLDIDSTPGQSAMLSVDDKERFEASWRGGSKNGKLISKYKDGYLAFYSAEGTGFAGVTPESTTIHPRSIVSASTRELVDSDIYDSLKVTYNNIFHDIQYEFDKMRGIDIMDIAGLDDLEVGGLKLRVFLGSSSHYTSYPATANHRMDDLSFFFEGKDKVVFADINKYVDVVTKVISLFIGRPIDPKSIELGKESKVHESMHDYALVEYSGNYEYKNLERNHSYGMRTSEAGILLHTICGALNVDINSQLSQWFLFVEADEKKYYLDSIMANLLSCAESVYYLTHKMDTKERELEFDTFLEQIAGMDIKPAKLKKFIQGAKKAYSDRVTYETKVLNLMKFVDIEPIDKQKTARYLNQLRNNLMHGTKPNWDAIVDKHGEPVESVEPIQIMFTMKEVVAKSFIKYLREQHS